MTNVYLGTAGGSSPLTRGKPWKSSETGENTRLIPAHAGKTTTGISRSNEETAHPRSRGENVSWFQSYLVPVGSSPLTRGKRVRQLPRAPGHGLIPAHAGKTTRSLPGVGARAAHPRSRGENDPDRHLCLLTTGSSPLTRGKRVTINIDADQAGLIPAHAGKTQSPRAVPPPQTAHPRSRGENRQVPQRHPVRGGSSPLTRGKPRGCYRAVNARGLIPAHAGKTAGPLLAPSRPEAHPRSRGENPVRR